MDDVPFLSRLERFSSVPSTNDVVRGWLDAGTPEVCLAVAGEQTAGRGRDGRTWTAPPGAGLLCSVGFRPTWLEPDRTWRLAAIVALAMADAAEEVAGLRDRSIRLKWPNDLVIEAAAGVDAAVSVPQGPGRRDAGDLPGAGRAAVRKLAGLLGETVGLGTGDPRAVVGIGVNADWPASEFPAELAPVMTSLRAASGGRPVDLEALLDAFLTRLEARTVALRGGRFDVADWVDRQLTNGRPVRLETPDGGSTVARALGVDAASGGLVIADPSRPGGERVVLTGEIVHLRAADATTARV